MVLVPQPSDAPAAPGADPGHISELPRPRPPALRATLMGSIAALLLSAAIALGSRMLRDFDSALLLYAVATVFLAFGLAYRCTARRSDCPPAVSNDRTTAPSCPRARAPETASPGKTPPERKAPRPAPLKEAPARRAFAGYPTSHSGRRPPLPSLLSAPEGS
ncbi:hypothetical protein GCM10012285_50610 [Streptomyces kronopolitis]|uniref:Uncharacterized protein n=1 Tax=Streptomyces kronopolitis TaxID=1612435 RepID=A0ABQ2JSS7_9ACTN|nr:hypothetical protein GCM10012285_50610 [Streptomyces kronopolitis]